MFFVKNQDRSINTTLYSRENENRLHNYGSLKKKGKKKITISQLCLQVSHELHMIEKIWFHQQAHQRSKYIEMVELRFWTMLLIPRKYDVYTLKMMVNWR